MKEEYRFITIYLGIIFIISSIVLPIIMSMIGGNDLPTLPVLGVFVTGVLFSKINKDLIFQSTIWSERIHTGQKRLKIDLKKIKTFEDIKELEELAKDKKYNKKVVFVNFNPNKLLGLPSGEKTIFQFDKNGWDIIIND